MFVEQRLFCLLHLGCLLLVRDSSRMIFQIPSLSVHVCIGKHNVGRQVCQHFGPIGFTTTKFYSDSFSTKKTLFRLLSLYNLVLFLFAPPLYQCSLLKSFWYLLKYRLQRRLDGQWTAAVCQISSVPAILFFFFVLFSCTSSL